MIRQWQTPKNFQPKVIEPGPNSDDLGRPGTLHDLGRQETIDGNDYAGAYPKASPTGDDLPAGQFGGPGTTSYGLVRPGVVETTEDSWIWNQNNNFRHQLGARSLRFVKSASFARIGICCGYIPEVEELINSRFYRRFP